MAIPTQKSRFNVLHISDDEDGSDNGGVFSKPKTRKNTRAAAAAGKTTKISNKTVEVPYLVTDQPKKPRPKKPSKMKQENGQTNGMLNGNEKRDSNDGACGVAENDEEFNRAILESQEMYQLEKLVRDTSIVDDSDEADKPAHQTRGAKAKEKAIARKSDSPQEIPQTLSDVASVLTRTKLESETQEFYDVAQFDSSHYEKILAAKDAEIIEHKSLAEKYKARFRRVLALINECEYKDTAEISIECDQLRKSIAEGKAIQDELMSQITEANREIEQLKSRNRDLEKEYSRKYQNK